MIETPVLIAGGGPVGLTLALNLARLGVPCSLVNDRKETTTHPKLDVVNCRSMEIFRQLGLAETIRAAGNPTSANQYVAFAGAAAGPFYTVLSNRHLIYQPVNRARELIRACEDGSLPLESMQRIAQMHLEPVLLQAAQADPAIDVRFGWKLFGFEQDSAGVTALIQQTDTGAQQHVRAQYLIGCDGPASRVRHFLNIEYDGTRDLLGELFIIHLRSDDIAGLYPNREPYWHTWLARPGFLGLIVSPSAGRNDYVLHRLFAPRGKETLDDIVTAALGQRLQYEIVQSNSWRPQFLVAESFGRDRVFIAGDATHQYMPTGGLGMNTGVVEAHNLAWKLSAVVKGWGGPRLLESYEAERLPIAQQNREHVKRCAAAALEIDFPMTGAALDDSSAGQAKRAELGAVFEGKIVRLYESLGIEIGYRYRGSPVIYADDAADPPYEEIVYAPAVRNGARLPSAFRSDGTAVFDQLGHGRFTLLVMGGNGSLPHAAALQNAAQRVGMPLELLSIEEPGLVRLYGKRFVLVRPDQHVCWNGDGLPANPEQLVDIVRGAGK